MATKIDLFEQEIIEGRLVDDEALAQYERMLRRCGDDWPRIQHTFLTAYNLPVERLEEAVTLINFGIDHYGSENYTVDALHMLGTIYRRAGRYQDAYDVYARVLPIMGNSRGSMPWCMVYCRLRINNYTYSPDMEWLHGLCLEESTFSRSFLDSRFFMAQLEYLIADHKGDVAARDAAYLKIAEMLEPGYKGPLTDMLKRHRIDETLPLNPDCMAFLERMVPPADSGRA